jgi:D-amino-acid dehydrogenase
MRVAVIGAGIVGVTTAQALLEDRHEVTVFERHGSVATETSFANAGLLAPGYVTPWAAPGMTRKVLKQWFDRDAAVRLAGMPGPALIGWLLRFYRACEPLRYAAARSAMLALARDSLERTQALATERAIEHERAQGLLVLLRGDAELAQSRAGLKVLAELGIRFHLVGPDACRAIEPALDASAALKAGIHLPEAEVGNCRQFALQLKTALQADGVAFRFHHDVSRLELDSDGVTVHAFEVPGDPETTFGAPKRGSVVPMARSAAFDAVVVCAANGAPALLPALRLPLQPVYGYSVTLPVRHHEGYPDQGPGSALMDERFKVAISRLGDRIRVAGSAELGGDPLVRRAGAIDTLYRVVQDWFPSATRPAGAQAWKGARPMLPDGPPAIGSAGNARVWINAGHGSSGWALACGSARLVADLVAARAPALDPQPFSPQRFH